MVQETRVQFPSPPLISSVNLEESFNLFCIIPSSELTTIHRTLEKANEPRMQKLKKISMKEGPFRDEQDFAV